MAKILNVDALSKQEREIVLGGNSYPVEEMSVENFIATTRKAEELAKGEGSIADQIESAVELVHRSVPTAPLELLRRVSLTNLQTLVQFVRGDELEQVEEQEEPVAEAGAPAKKRPARK